MSLHVGLYTGLSAIRAAQAGIDTASHNVANSATKGYTRQSLLLDARPPFDSTDGPIGTGVDVASIRRMRDQFLDARVRSSTAEFAEADMSSQLLGRAEAVMNEPDNGVSAELDKLWTSFEDLAIDPSEPAVRREVISQLESLTARVSSVANQWDQLAADTTVQRQVTIDEANQWATEVADINRQVANAASGTVSNDLLDRRDLLVDQLAEATGAQATAQSDGTVTVTLGGTDWVAGNTATTLATAGPNNSTLELDGNDVTAATSGEIGAIHQFVTTDLPSRQADLDDFTVELADALNTQHAAGFRPDGTAGGALLAYNPADPAGSLTVAVTDTDELAAASTAGAELDGSNAQALADLRTTDVNGSSTLNDMYTTLTVDLGAQVAAADRAATATGDIAVAAERARESQHGVSIDEEMVDMVRYQRMLEAAARVMTTIDQALDTLVNRVGVVGR